MVVADRVGLFNAPDEDLHGNRRCQQSPAEPHQRRLTIFCLGMRKKGKANGRTSSKKLRGRQEGTSSSEAFRTPSSHPVSNHEDQHGAKQSVDPARPQILVLPARNLHCISTSAREIAPGRRVRIRVVRLGQVLIFGRVVVNETGRGCQPGLFEGVARAWAHAHYRDFAG